MPMQSVTLAEDPTFYPDAVFDRATTTTPGEWTLYRIDASSLRSWLLVPAFKALVDAIRLAHPSDPPALWQMPAFCLRGRPYGGYRSGSTLSLQVSRTCGDSLAAAGAVLPERLLIDSIR